MRLQKVLDSADDAIARTDTLIGKLIQIKAGLLRDLLFRGLDGNCELRKPEKHPEQFEKSSLGLVPKEWTSGRLGDFCGTSSGGTPRRDVDRYWGGNIPWVKTTEINYGVIESTQECITHIGVASSAAKSLPAGTVVMALFGQGPTRGRVAMLGIDAAVNQACLAFLPDDRLSPKYLFWLLTGNYDRIRGLSNAGTQANLNSTIVRNMLIAVPRKDGRGVRDEQGAIVDRLECLERRIHTEEQYRNKVSADKDGPNAGPADWPCPRLYERREGRPCRSLSRSLTKVLNATGVSMTDMSNSPISSQTFAEKSSRQS